MSSKKRQCQLVLKPAESCRLMNNFHLNQALDHSCLIDCTESCHTDRKIVVHIDRILNDFHSNIAEQKEPARILSHIDAEIEQFDCLVMVVAIVIGAVMNNFPNLNSLVFLPIFVQFEMLVESRNKDKRVQMGKDTEL
jgi:hypothetical protein